MKDAGNTGFFFFQMPKILTKNTFLYFTMFLYFFPSYLQVDLQLRTPRDGCCGGSHRNDSSCRISHTGVDEVSGGHLFDYIIFWCFL